ncbi:MAG: cyclodeaminase/cyclohydrolase family protein [Anaerolineae bacterium]|jgi:formiminotetrahydrofolate cyclodeaminase|nr:cyclodeaminase/cyclohydrolase family protein [Anaerolineae bacterium]
MLTDHSVNDFGSYVAGQSHAMAGATIAASAALACALGEACARISTSRLEDWDNCARAEGLADQLGSTRATLTSLADLDGEALLAFEAAAAAGRAAEGKDHLCRLPLEIGVAACSAAAALQAFRPLVRGVQDDLEMAITLLSGAGRAAALLLDSNLRIWPEPELLAAYEPELARLRQALAGLEPATSVR